MLLLKRNPVTNGLRHQLIIQKNLLSKSNRIIKALSIGIKNFSGRSSATGSITVRHRGGACKKLFRKVNITNDNIYSIVLAICYDPQRNSFIALQYDFLQNFFFYSSATDSVFPGSLIICSDYTLDLYLGFRIQIKNIPTGSLIYNISLRRIGHAKYIRSAGSFGQLIQKDLNFCQIKFPSNKILLFSTDSYGTLGISSNLKSNLVCIGKAGKSRLLGKRPSVRGVAMNPIDHPHGGRTNGGCTPVTPWGIPTRGKPTVKKK